MTIVNRLGSTALALALTCVSATATLAQESGETLNIRLNADIRSTDPGINRDANTDAVMVHVVEGLVAFRDDSSVGPMLAETIDVSEDGTTYTFKLREGVKFHNGEPLTADDVLFAWNRYMTPENNWTCLPEFDGSGDMEVTGVRAVDPLTVEFKLAEPSALFLKTMARTDCGTTGIYHRSSLAADGTWDKPIGTGPFQFGEWASSQYVELTRFDGYSALSGERDGLTGNKTPLVPAVRFVVIPDASAAKAALRAGQLDIIFRAEPADVAELSGDSNLVIDNVPSMELNGVLFQTRDELLKDVRIREAILLSLDLPSLVRAVAGDEAKASLSVVPPSSANYGAAQAVLPARDLERSKALLAEAGYAGAPITMVTSNEYQYMFDTAVLMQAMALEAGINIQLEVLDWATELDRYRSGSYQMVSFGYSSRLDPTLSFAMVSGNKDEEPRKVWDNPDALALIAQSARETDPAARQAIFDQLDALFRKDLPMIPTYSPVTTSAVRSNIQGYAGWALAQPRAWGVTKGN